MSARRGLLQDSSSSSDEQDLMEDEGDQHLPPVKKQPVKKQVVSKKISKAKHIASKPTDTQILPSRASLSKRQAEPDTQILPSRASSSKRRAADSPAPRQRKHKTDKKNEQVPSESESEEEEEDVTKTEDLSKPSLSKNNARSKEKHDTLHHAIDVFPSGDVSSKKLSKKKEEVKEPVVEDKILKKKKGGEDTTTAFKRVWSEEDEITILKGLIDHAGSNAVSSVDMNTFYEVIKDSLHLDATKTQLISKVRKMKWKFQATLLKGKKGKNGVNSEAFQLGKEIWGTGGNSKNLDMVKLVGAGAGPSSHVGADNLDNQISIAVSRLNPGSTKLEIEKRWKELKRKGIELNLEKIEILRDAATIEAEELNSSE